ncbi:MAG TPA: DNA translocase FtsK 4TM domain-containing protein [Polyangiaceae bacterium]|nr:DNA translocase FtsK 4TM domain-containing protein [Polyangiaceae bacterium]
MAFPLLAQRRAEPALPPNNRVPTVVGKGAGALARHREVAALALWTGAVFLTLALASYAGEPVLAAVAENATPREPIVGENWVGPVGEACARCFVQLVGVAAWVVPLEMFLLGIPFVRGKQNNITPARLGGDMLMLVIAAALVQVGWPTAVAFGKQPAAGLVGELFGEVGRSLFSSIGSFLVGFSLLGLILIARATFSFIALMRSIATFFREAALRLVGGARAISEAWRAARDLERDASEKQRAEDAPKILRASPDEVIVAALPETDPEDDVFVPTEESAAPPPAKPKRARPRRAAAETDDASPSSPSTAAISKEPADEAPSPKAASGEEPDEPPSRPRAKPAPRRAERSGTDGASATDDDGDPSGGSSASSSSGPADEAVDEAVDAAPRAPKAPRAAEAAPKAKFTIVDTSAALAPAKLERGDKLVPALGAGFRLPPLDMLEAAVVDPSLMLDEAALHKNAELLVKTLADYKISGKVEEILPGPVVTTFEVSPVAGTKVSRVAALADDLALALAKKVRIVAPIPGKNRIGFELPNEKRLSVNLRELVEDRRFQSLDVPLPVVLGRDIVGNPVYADLASMPHVIVAGATGAGKSVGINVMLTSLLYRRSPEEMRLLLIDPKVVELAPFDRIPHMLLPVVTDMKQAATALKWAVDEMERRYQLFADAGTKNISTYNGWVKRVERGEARNPLPKQVIGKDFNGFEDAVTPGEGEEGTQPLPEKLPHLVIVVDEFADLMMQQGKDVETSVARLAQKARAAGMHVILATQRPSVDVITGMIKANFPTRIAFRVAQKIDSRTILDEQGAEHLLGKGDMLVKLNGTNDTKRVQCPFLSEEEVLRVMDFLRLQGEPVYDENILKPRDDEAAAEDTEDAEQDPMYDQAVRLVADTKRCSTSWLQRKLGLGYNRAARIVEMMEKRGLVGGANGSKDREVLFDAI